MKHQSRPLIAPLCALIILSSTAQANQVSIETLLSEMTDMARLCKRPSPGYTEGQASSYSRVSKDVNTAWFDNRDFGQYIRKEIIDGRTEYVMADLKGPGTLLRVWSANPMGMIRFYFDGEKKPRIEEGMVNLLTGKSRLFKYPFSYMVSQGTNLYFPIPYSKSLKVTVDDSDAHNDALYYEFNYRTFDKGTKVKSFNLKDLADSQALVEKVAEQLQNPGPSLTASAPKQVLDTEIELLPNNPHKIRLASGSNAIYTLKAQITGGSDDLPWNDPMRLHNLLRNVILQIDFDGETCVLTPIGDFFGSAPGLNPYESVPFTVTKDGWMICRFVMPYKKSAEITLLNVGTKTVRAKTVAVTSPYRFDDSTYHFKAQWGGYYGSTRPARDMTFLKTTGEGMFIGDNMHIANGSTRWWGEGDEKIYIDNEVFPSTFGTGTEDYFGYAWCSNKPFQAPYHAQPRCDGPGNFAHSSVNRWHIFDSIPYKTAFQFDMELLHHVKTTATYIHTAYWYGLPGTPGPRQIARALLPVPELVLQPTVKRDLEGELLRIAERTGGETEAQAFDDLSNGHQLWWRNMEIGNKLVLAVPVKEAGTYRVSGFFCKAADYGIHQLLIDGKPLGQPIDFYSPNLEWKQFDLGTVQLPAGEVMFEVRCMGKNNVADEGFMFGLDYLELKKP